VLPNTIVTDLATSPSPNEGDDAISRPITSAVERLEAASARDQAETARHRDVSNWQGDNADLAI
jgi:hypothetical protein